MSSDIRFDSATKHVWNRESVPGGKLGRALFTGAALLADLGRSVGYYLELNDGKLSAFWKEKQIEAADPKPPEELDLPESVDPDFEMELDPIEEEEPAQDVPVVEEAPPAPVEPPFNAPSHVQLLQSEEFKTYFSKIGKSDASRKNYNQQVVDFAEQAQREIEQGSMPTTIKFVNDLQEWAEQLTQSYRQNGRTVIGINVIHFGSAVKQAKELLLFGDAEHDVKGIFSEIGAPEVSQCLTKRLFEELESSLDVSVFKERVNILQRARLLQGQDLSLRQLAGTEEGDRLVESLKQFMFEKFKNNRYPDAQVMYAMFMKEGLNDREIDIMAIAKEAQIAALKEETEQSRDRIEALKEEIKELKTSLRFANRAKELQAIVEQDKKALQAHLQKVNKLNERLQRLESELSDHYSFNCKEAVKSVQQLEEMEERFHRLESDVQKSKSGSYLLKELEQLKRQLAPLEKQANLSAKNLENFLKKSTLTAERIDAEILECTDRIAEKRGVWRDLLIRINQIEQMVAVPVPKEQPTSTMSKITLVASGILGLAGSALYYDQFYNNGALTAYLNLSQ